jgi:Alternative oxidase
MSKNTAYFIKNAAEMKKNIALFLLLKLTFSYLNYTGFRHFRSLRTLERDRGWIATLLEEAENERMHLLLCLNKFKAGKTGHLLKQLHQEIVFTWCALMHLN